MIFGNFQTLNLNYHANVYICAWRVGQSQVGFWLCKPLNFWQVMTGEHFAVVYRRRDRFVRFKVVLCRTMICEHPKRTENVSKPFR